MQSPYRWGSLRTIASTGFTLQTLDLGGEPPIGERARQFSTARKANFPATPAARTGLVLDVRQTAEQEKESMRRKNRTHALRFQHRHGPGDIPSNS